MELLVKVNDNIKTELMGYTGKNLLKKKFYQTNSCYVHANLIEPLNNIQSELNKILNKMIK